MLPSQQVSVCLKEVVVVVVGGGLSLQLLSTHSGTCRREKISGGGKRQEELHSLFCHSERRPNQLDHEKEE